MRTREKVKAIVFVVTFVWVGIFQMASEEFLVLETSVVWAQKKNDKPQEGPQEEVKPAEAPKLPERPKTINLEKLRMMEKIERKTRELKKREKEIGVKETQLKALEAKIREDLQKIEVALQKSKELIGVSTDLREENLASLVKIYSAMRPEDAAPLISALNEKIAVQIISKMKSKIAGQVMSKLDTQAAKKISEKIVGADLFADGKK